MTNTTGTLILHPTTTGQIESLTTGNITVLINNRSFDSPYSFSDGNTDTITWFYDYYTYTSDDIIALFLVGLILAITTASVIVYVSTRRKQK